MAERGEPCSIESQHFSTGTTRILLLRHAETAAPDLFHGAESDVGLGERGRAQAVAVATRLAAERPAAVYASPMRRALETATPIAEACGLEVTVLDLLHERRMGPLSGTSKAEGWPVYHEVKERWKAGELGFTHAGGESYQEMRDRLVPPLLELAARHRGETIVVVAHGVANRILLTTLAEEFSHADFDRIGIEFVAVNELVCKDGVWSVTLPVSDQH